MLFVWDQKYNTGIDEIDHDHRALVKLINDLYEAIQDGSGGALLLPIFSALKHYTETHFAREEQFMAINDVPNQGRHVQEHQKMVEKLADLEKRHRGGEAAISLQTLTFLRDWLKNHICVQQEVYFLADSEFCLLPFRGKMW
ncbi:MAG: bacteriohemerythrin [Desulfuromonadales bacterium]